MGLQIIFLLLISNFIVVRELYADSWLFLETYFVASMWLIL